MDNEKIIEYLRKNLSNNRFVHTIGVAKTAKSLAEKYGADPEKAYTAGLLHDCAKELSLEKMLSVANKYNAEVDDIMKSSKALMHGIAGAYIARELFDIDDEIFNAILYHTTGKADMSLLEKIVYIADSAEPNRNFNGVNEIREAAARNINEAVITSCGGVIVHTVNKGEMIHPNTVEARNYLLLCNRSDAENEEVYR